MTSASCRRRRRQVFDQSTFLRWTRPVAPDFSEEDSAAVVGASFVGAADPRLRELLTGLVGHLHQFVREVELTDLEWQQAIAFLTEAGRWSQGVRQELILLSDV